MTLIIHIHNRTERVVQAQSNFNVLVETCTRVHVSPIHICCYISVHSFFSGEIIRPTSFIIYIFASTLAKIVIIDNTFIKKK